MYDEDSMINSTYKHCNLTGVRPDVLQQTVVLSQTVQRIITFTSSSDVTT